MGAAVRTAAELKDRRDALRILEDWPFDFRFEWPSSDRAGFRLEDNGAVEIVAGDSAGNRFALLGDRGRETRPLLYVDHDGAAGVIASHLQQGLQIIVDVPYWRDLLKFSRGGDLAPMQRAALHLERALHEEVADIAGLRAELRRELSLPALPDAVSALHQVVAAWDGRLRVLWDGEHPCESLFGRFAPEDNPAWRK